MDKSLYRQCGQKPISTTRKESISTMWERAYNDNVENNIFIYYAERACISNVVKTNIDKVQKPISKMWKEPTSTMWK